MVRVTCFISGVNYASRSVAIDEMAGFRPARNDGSGDLWRRIVRKDNGFPPANDNGEIAAPRSQ